MGARRLRLPRNDMRHHFTVDVEEYFQVTALEAAAPPISWGRFESRVDASVGRLLDLLAAHAARATFFVLGCGGGPPPRARQNDRRGRARDRVARMGPRAAHAPDARRLSPFRTLHQGGHRTPDRASRAGIPRAQLLDRARARVGARRAYRGRLPLRL